MTWTTTEFENYVERELEDSFGPEKARQLYSGYVDARPKVLLEIERIAKTEPNLTDHGPRHIADVMRQVFSIIGSDKSDHALEARDLYILLQSILFHDVGNLHGRNRHNERVGNMFINARGNGDDLRRERDLVVRTARAHSGKSSAGDKNTLIELDDHAHSPFGPIKQRSIAAILRLGDELAEGPQRTTRYYRENVGYDEKSKIFHEYSRCTSIMADRASGRICLTYDIDVEDFLTGTGAIDRPRLEELICFVRYRIAKLDQERRYTKFYCRVIEPFNRTEVTANFAFRGERLPYRIEFSLDDLVVPDDNLDGETSVTRARFGEVDAVLSSVEEALKTVKDHHDD